MKKTTDAAKAPAKPNRAQRRQSERKPHPNPVVEARKTIAPGGQKKHISEATIAEIQNELRNVKATRCDLADAQENITMRMRQNRTAQTELENELRRREMAKKKADDAKALQDAADAATALDAADKEKAT